VAASPVGILEGSWGLRSWPLPADPPAAAAGSGQGAVLGCSRERLRGLLPRSSVGRRQNSLPGDHRNQEGAKGKRQQPSRTRHDGESMSLSGLHSQGRYTGHVVPSLLSQGALHGCGWESPLLGDSRTGRDGAGIGASCHRTGLALQGQLSQQGESSLGPWERSTGQQQWQGRESTWSESRTMAQSLWVKWRAPVHEARQGRSTEMEASF